MAAHSIRRVPSLRRWWPILFALPWAACTAAGRATGSATSPQRAPDPPPARAATAVQATGTGYRAGVGEWGERAVVDAWFVPGVWLQVPARDIGSASGTGYGLRAGIGNRDQSIGVLYQGFDLDADPADFWLHSVYIDFDERMALNEGGGAFKFVAGGGLGGAWFDFAQGNVGTSSEGAMELRLGIDFQPSRTFALELGGGGVLYGHLGDTAAYGSFVSLGGSLTF